MLCMHEAMQSALLVSDTRGWPQVNLKTSNGSTALHNAASSGHADVMRLLIAANCNVNIHTLGSASALYNAATGGEATSCTQLSVCIKGCRAMAGAAPHGQYALCSQCPLTAESTRLCRLCGLSVKLQSGCICSRF